jgi:hypothetical protein
MANSNDFELEYTYGRNTYAFQVLVNCVLPESSICLAEITATYNFYSQFIEQNRANICNSGQNSLPRDIDWIFFCLPHYYPNIRQYKSVSIISNDKLVTYLKWNNTNPHAQHDVYVIYQLGVISMQSAIKEIPIIMISRMIALIRKQMLEEYSMATKLCFYLIFSNILFSSIVKAIMSPSDVSIVWLCASIVFGITWRTITYCSIALLLKPYGLIFETLLMIYLNMILTCKLIFDWP